MVLGYHGIDVAPSDLMIFELSGRFTAEPILQVTYPEGTVIRFDDDGVVVADDDADVDVDRVEQLEFVVPLLPGMTDVIVKRASLNVRGARRDQLAVEVSKTSTSPDLTLSGRQGGLRSLQIHGWSVPSGHMEIAGAGSAVYRWRNGTLHKTSNSSASPLHLMVRPPDGAGFGPPQTAVPHYNMPDNAGGLYDPILAGATLHLDSPSTGVATVNFNPPVDGERVQLFLGHNRASDNAHNGLPHEASPVNWSAGEVRGIWASAPTAVTMSAKLGQSDPVVIAEFGAAEMPAAPTAVDFTPGARSLLSKAYAAADPDIEEDLTLVIDATSDTAGDLHATDLAVTAHYRLESIDSAGAEVSLRGTPATIDLPVAEGLVPARLALTIDGSFGPGVRVADSDEDMPGRQQGLRITGSAIGGRRVVLTTRERGRPLIRVAVYGRATEATELLLSLSHDEFGRKGVAMTDTVAIQIVPSLDPTWHRVDLPAPIGAAVPSAVWLCGQVSTGTFWWCADSVGDDDAAVLSVDDGSTWSDVAVRPVSQIHYATERPVASPLELRSSLGILATDVLALPAERTRIETSALDGLDRGFGTSNDDERGTGERVSTKPLTIASTSVTFRKEGVQPVAAAALANIATVGSALRLTFASERDADFRVLDAELTYDPWGAK